MRHSGSARFWPTELPGGGQVSCPWLSWAVGHPHAVRGCGEADAVAQRAAESYGYAEEVQPETQPSSIRSPRPAVRQAAASTADSSQRYRVVRCVLAPVTQRGCVEPPWTDTGHVPVAGYTPWIGR